MTVLLSGWRRRLCYSTQDPKAGAPPGGRFDVGEKKGGLKARAWASAVGAYRLASEEGYVVADGEDLRAVYRQIRGRHQNAYGAPRLFHAAWRKLFAYSAALSLADGRRGLRRERLSRRARRAGNPR